MRLNYKKQSGFTLAELLMAIWVISIIMTAVAALSFALGSANDSADDTAEIQSRVRYAIFKITETIKNCKLICVKGTYRIIIWESDDNQDGQINPDEVAVIEYSPSKYTLAIYDFTCSEDFSSICLSIDNLANGSVLAWLSNNCSQNSATVLTDCTNVIFCTDAEPPMTGKVDIAFRISNNGTVEIYRISASLRSRADCLLDDSGEVVAEDDDM